MPRRPRLFIPGAIYHVYCRVARGELVFDDGREADEFVEALQEVRDLDGWEVLAWCLMGNHAVERYGLPPSRVAAALAKDPTTVSRWLSKGLPRISHTLPAAAAEAPAGTAFLAAAQPATCLEHDSAPPWSKHRADRRLRALATKVCEKCGLPLQLEDKAFADRIETLHRALSDPACDNAEMPRVAP